MTDLNPDKQASPPGWLVVLAFGIIYVIWGSTYLGIRFAIETIPPFLMAGSRFFISGAILFAATLLMGDRPTREQWKSAAVLGAFLLLGGNGLVTLAEKRVPSGLAALIVAMVPIWTVLLDWLRPKGTRPRSLTFIGVMLGFGGVAFLSSAKDHHGEAVVDMIGAAMLFGATLSWSIGTLYGRHSAKSSSIVQFSGMQMLAGGALMLATGLLRGEAKGFELSSISRQSAFAWVYLTVIGGLIAFTAFAWLVKVSAPSKVATTAYVNPLIAVFFGAWLGHEPISESIIIGGSAIIGAVVLMTLAKSSPPASVRVTGEGTAAPERI